MSDGDGRFVVRQIVAGGVCDEEKCLVSREGVVGKVGSADCDFKSRCAYYEQQEESWRESRVLVKVVSFLRDSLVNGAATGWKVKSVELDLVAQSYPLEHICPRKIVVQVRLTRTQRPADLPYIDRQVLIDFCKNPCWRIITLLNETRYRQSKHDGSSGSHTFPNLLLRT
jgi:hypothetical protein